MLKHREAIREVSLEVSLEEMAEREESVRTRTMVCLCLGEPELRVKRQALG